ncbi:hypothetical protein, partial [Glycomyces sp. NPDC047010]|uniref:hypothetical protein n=1 Tax=Glycomyces sp. NPDC047010 TaxID=3155023 RepID=UPI0033E67E45
KRIEDQLVNRDMALELTDNAKLYLGHKGYDPVMGARPLRRTIQREIEDTLSEKILTQGTPLTPHEPQPPRTSPGWARCLVENFFQCGQTIPLFSNTVLVD